MDKDREMPGVPAPQIKPISFLYVQIGWKATYLKAMPGFRQLDIYPTNEYPYGRKGYSLSVIWRVAKEPHTKGMLILDGDVAIDPHDFQAMEHSMRSNPDSIHIGAAKIWPISTNFSTWVWAHRQNGAESILDWQNFTEKPDTFSFCFTYLPAKLIEAAISAGLEEKTYPGVDYFVTKTAQNLSIPMHVVAGCNPKHMNY